MKGRAMTRRTRRNRIKGFVGLCADVEAPIRLNEIDAEHAWDRELVDRAGRPIHRATLLEYLDDERSQPRCRVCGCIETDCSDCVERTGEPCFWVESDLCSACATPEQRDAAIAELLGAVEIRLVDDDGPNGHPGVAG